jgi:hypothetical protein
MINIKNSKLMHCFTIYNYHIKDHATNTYNKNHSKGINTSNSVLILHGFVNQLFSVKCSLPKRPQVNSYSGNELMHGLFDRCLRILTALLSFCLMNDLTSMG